MSNILTPDKVNMASEAEPHEILLAIHKRVVDTEKLMADYRNYSKNQQIEVEMLKERIASLEKKLKPLLKKYDEDAKEKAEV
jgi:chromosome condensin MukBEF ATPase and DNA-binding subunit MukB